MASPSINWDDFRNQALIVEGLLSHPEETEDSSQGLSEMLEPLESPLLISKIAAPHGLVMLSPDITAFSPLKKGNEKYGLKQKDSEFRTPLKDFSNISQRGLQLLNESLMVTPVKSISSEESSIAMCPTSAEFREFLTSVLEVSTVPTGDSFEEEEESGMQHQCLAATPPTEDLPVMKTRARSGTYSLITPSCDLRGLYALESESSLQEIQLPTKPENQSTLSDSISKNTLSDNNANLPEDIIIDILDSAKMLSNGTDNKIDELDNSINTQEHVNEEEKNVLVVIEDDLNSCVVKPVKKILTKSSSVRRPLLGLHNTRGCTSDRDKKQQAGAIEIKNAGAIPCLQEESVCDINIEVISDTVQFKNEKTVPEKEDMLQESNDITCVVEITNISQKLEFDEAKYEAESGTRYEAESGTRYENDRNVSLLADTKCEALSVASPLPETIFETSTVASSLPDTKCETLSIASPLIDTKCEVLSVARPLIDTKCEILSMASPLIDTKCEILSVASPLIDTNCEALSVVCLLPETKCETLSIACSLPIVTCEISSVASSEDDSVEVQNILDADVEQVPQLNKTTSTTKLVRKPSSKADLCTSNVLSKKTLNTKLPLMKPSQVQSKLPLKKSSIGLPISKLPGPISSVRDQDTKRKSAVLLPQPAPLKKTVRASLGKAENLEATKLICKRSLKSPSKTTEQSRKPSKIQQLPGRQGIDTKTANQGVVETILPGNMIQKVDASKLVTRQLTRRTSLFKGGISVSTVIKTTSVASKQLQPVMDASRTVSKEVVKGAIKAKSPAEGSRTVTKKKASPSEAILPANGSKTVTKENQPVISRTVTKVTHPEGSRTVTLTLGGQPPDASRNPMNTPTCAKFLAPRRLSNVFHSSPPLSGIVNNSGKAHNSFIPTPSRFNHTSGSQAYTGTPLI